jgi:hypothetical protein
MILPLDAERVGKSRDPQFEVLSTAEQLGSGSGSS